MKVENYNSKIIKVAAHITDAKTFLSEWNENISASENFNRFLEINIFGKPSRAATKNILAAFKERFVLDNEQDKALRRMAKVNVDPIIFDWILYYYTVQADDLLYDFVTKYLYDFQLQGNLSINTKIAQDYISNLSKEGKTTAVWSETVCNRVARNILTTLRDFRILEGKVKKTIKPPYLPTEAFVYIAYLIYQKNISGQKVINAEDWKLFLCSSNIVEHMFMDAHQKEYLTYYSAGSLVRIDFNYNNLEGLVDAIIERTIRFT